ncbi:VTT domain-containing protein [Magnetospirillum sp. UT-4]|uniref:VTT domain-containing protein n=1 Tax=Magnetospirillum sp. UT-4 TaxID=2681467 RepID=UPI0013851695|nr:VTT domain-containing protein [Magnetospirillum sp. UT-4]CAA7618388.1 Phospholipase D [Magnetospirillum sp. UT-4]
MNVPDLCPAEVARPRLARPGVNCWRMARANRFAAVVDGAEYFRALEHALRRARRSVLVLGWEFDSRTRLGRDAGARRIGPLLDRLVRARPGLTVRLLIWDSALIYAVNREFAGLVKMDWLTHPRLHFRLDDSHPLGACHHQKVVVVDEALAFAGGLDITSQRWDSRAHLPADPRRNDPGFPAYPPFHDVMAVVSGPAAAALGALARTRWHAATGEFLTPVAAGDCDALWPPWLAPLLGPVEVALARTLPPWDGAPAVREVERLYCDMIAAARRFIYAENQYLASRQVGEALAERLARPDCPEILLVLPAESVSLLERSTMGVARARLAARLAEADRFGRLRLVYPAVAGTDVKVHSKVMVVDDQVLRIGSSNLNNRSMGLDSECDLMVEAAGDAAVAAGIRAFRRDLMAEHLGVSPARVAEIEAAAGGLFAAVEALGTGERRLAPVPGVETGPVVRLMADSAFPDPEEPVETLDWLDSALPAPARRPLRLRLGGLMLGLGAMAVAATMWRWAPPDWWWAAAPWLALLPALPGRPWTLPAAIALFVAAGLARLPLAPLVLLTGAVLGAGAGMAAAAAGTLASAALSYALGRAAGRAWVRRTAGWKVNRVSRRLVRQGLLAVLLLRLVPMAPFPVVNLVAGAAGVRFSDFVAGTVLGMAPAILAMSVLGERLLAVLRNPSVPNIAVLALATLLVIGLQLGLMRRLGRVGPAAGP